MEQIYGLETNPIYIYTPRWINSSAGIKSLHYLCHALNESGFTAYLVLTEPQFKMEPRINPALRTPILTQEVADSHYKIGKTPLVVYTETVPGNILNAQCVVRYLMNYVGALGGPKDFDKSEKIVSFSKNIARDAALNQVNAEDILFIPPVDPKEMKFNLEKENFQLVYAGKYRSFVGRPFKVGRLPSIEIFREGPRMQSRREVIDLLSKAKVLYAFENSSICTESILSGTPVYFVPNQFNQSIIAEHELGNGGVVEIDTDESIENATKSISKAIDVYNKQLEIFIKTLPDIFNKYIEWASQTEYKRPIQVPNFNTVVTLHRRRLGYEILRNQGFIALMRVTYKFVLRRLTWRFWLKAEK